MLRVYLLLESIAKTYEEIVLEILPMCEFRFLENIHIIGIDLELMEQYIVMIMRLIKLGHM